MSKDLDLIFITLESKFEIAAKKALLNALSSGYGFIIVKRSKAGYKEFIVKSALWPDIHEAMADLGAIGGFAGRD